MSGQADSVATLAAIGIIAYVWAELFHELLGHGAACAITGGRIASFSAFHLECRGGSQVLVTAAGLAVNIAAGLLAMASSSVARKRRTDPSWRYFLALAAAYNLFGAFGYVVSSALSRSGDFANFARLSRMAGGVEIAVTVLAVALYVGAIVHVGRGLGALLAGDRRRRWAVVFVPYFSAAVAALAAAAVYGLVSRAAAWMSAVGTTLGCWGFLVLPFLAARRVEARSPEDAEPITSSTRWFVLAIASFSALLVVAFGFNL